jgi:hypothetical protein
MNAKCNAARALVTVALAATLAAGPAGAIMLFDVAPGAELEPVPVYEYHNAAYDRYFSTSSVAEIANLESGRIPGWERTAAEPSFLAFAVPVVARYVEAGAAASPVCRYFIPPAGHFYSASPAECDVVGRTHPEYVLEAQAAFYAWQPEKHTGKCPLLAARIGGFTFAPVYRLWNPAGESMHRYTLSEDERARMVAQGWVAEGYGDKGVAMCAPVWRAP